MLRRWEYNELICVFGIMTCLLYLVQSTDLDAIKQLLYKIKVAQEETKSLHVPEDYLCDACIGVAYSEKMLRRWEYNELICVFGIMTCLLYCVQSTDIDAIKQLLYKIKVAQEETKGLHVPEDYLCDACLGVAYSLEQLFLEVEKRHTKTKLTESSLVEAVDQLCENEYYWESYGLREIDGKKRFDGPGLETQSMFGLTIEGEVWPKRMMDLCWRLTGETETLELYQIYKKGKLKETLCHQGKKKYCKPTRKESDEL